MKVLVSTLVLALATGTSLAADAPKPDAKPVAAAKGAAKPGAAKGALAQIDAQIQGAKVNKANAQWRTSLAKPQAAKFAPGEGYVARMETTKGPVTIKLLPDVAPMHVTSFIYLSRLGFYDGLAFHRVIPGFMAQGGCPLGTGTGNPGYQFGAEIGSSNKHDRPGLLSAANTPQPETDGSQFFLTFVPTPWLDSKHTIYGQVVEGMDTLQKLEAAGTAGGKTTEPLKIVKVTIEPA